LVRKGINPIEAEKAKRRQEKVEAARVSFAECAARYRAGWTNAKHVGQWVATFAESKRGKRKYPAATEAINALPIATIDTGLVLKCIEPMWSTTPETASRVRGRIELVLDWAKVRKLRDGENPARWRGHLDKLLPRRGKLSRGHHEAVPCAELPAFMAELRARPGVAARALEWTILRATRTGEAVGARWAELDLEARLWTIPASRTKTQREHRVPLADRALAILAKLPAEAEHGFVFIGGRFGAPPGHSAMLGVI
jgi:integrase